MKIDKKDRRIIYELWQDCRRPLGEIAKEVGVSKQALHYRISRLVEKGVITTFIAAINVAKLGYINHEAWLQFRAVPAGKRHAFAAYLAGHPNVRLVAECGGKFDLLVGILAENPVQFSSLFRDILRKFPDIVKNYVVLISTDFYAYPRTHLLEKEERKRPQHIAEEPRKIALDETEQKVLFHLSNNARIPVMELAKKAGVTASTVRAKLKRLQNEGVIVGYTIQFEHSRIGYENYEVFASLHDMNENKEKELEEYCRSNPYSTYLLKCIGKWDIDIGFDAKDSGHFQHILTEFRDRFSDVISDYEFVSTLRWNKFTYYPFKA